MVRRRMAAAAVALICAMGLFAADTAEARKGFSFGSRGSRTYQAPATTPTAPAPAAPIQRSTTPQGATQSQPGQAQPGAAAQRPQTPARPSMFGSGLGGSLMRGLLIGGLIGMLLGHGLGGLAGILGLLLQVALVGLVVMLVLRFMRRPQPAPAGYSPRVAAGMGGWPGAGRAAPASNAPPAQAPSGAPPARGGDEIGVAGADLDIFEHLLGEIQVAFGREDQATLKAHTTPEVFAFFADELRENAERGVRNEISDVKLLQGDIAEAWREGARDYATVAMRFSLNDRLVDRASGRGRPDGDASGERTEVWTFTREAGGDWKLAAIQGA